MIVISSFNSYIQWNLPEKIVFQTKYNSIIKLWTLFKNWTVLHCCCLHDFVFLRFVVSQITKSTLVKKRQNWQDPCAENTNYDYP